MIEQYFNPGQQEVMNIGARDNVIVAGRGWGKGIVHSFIELRNFQRMPGCNVGFISANCKRCLTNTLPSMIIHWENWGFKRNVHYAIGIKPPERWGWKKPIFEPANWENTISFYNGSIGTIISQDRKGTSNSLSLDFLDIDEAKFIDFEQLKDETFPANRGNEDRFGNRLYHHGMLVTSDMPTTKKGSWFLKYKNDCDQELIDVIAALVTEEYDIRKKALKSGRLTEYSRLKLAKIGQTLSKLRSKALFYKEYSSIFNLQILGEEFIKRMKRDLPPLTFQTSIMCNKIGASIDGFYSAFHEDNKYTMPNTVYLDSLAYDMDKLKHVDSRMDGDVDTNRPLMVSFDYNANINWMVVAQVDRRGKLRILKSFYVKYERKLPELLDDFMLYYGHHNEKSVVFYYDSTAVGNNYALRNEDFHNYITNYLEDHGWMVNDIYIGKPMQHLDKMLLINRAFRGRATHMIMINSENNEDLLISIESAGVYNGKKDKRGEKLAETEEDKLEMRTDGSDAFDTVVIGAEKFPQIEMF